MNAKNHKFIVNSQLLTNYLKSKNLSKKEFAALCGISVFKLRSFLKGKNVNGKTLYSICKHSGLSAKSLVKFSNFGEN